MRVTYQAASAACRATAGHVKTPTSLAPAAAFARTATATLLYSSIAATNPGTARFGPSLRASQQAQPNESKAAPAIRATTSAAGASSDAPSKNATTSVGDTSSITPAAVSTNAVTISSCLATISWIAIAEAHADLSSLARCSGGALHARRMI